jgi:uncharacterized membrane protein YuzA (DUF378 family)
MDGGFPALTPPHMKTLHIIAFILVVIGAINWGLVGLGGFMSADWNVVHMILGSMMSIEWLLYVLIGLSGIWLAFSHRKHCRACTAGGTAPAGM